MKKLKGSPGDERKKAKPINFQDPSDLKKYNTTRQVELGKAKPKKVGKGPSADKTKPS